MATMPPEQPSAPQAPPVVPPSPYGGIGRGPTTGAILPVPGNAELAIWLIVEIVLGIVCLVAEDFDSHGWAIATTWLTAAYILSRGIAKASRVLEQ
jgi:hypothetical protein